MNLDEFRHKAVTYVVSILFLCTQDWNFAINYIFKRFGFVCAFVWVEFERLLHGCEQLVLWANISGYITIMPDTSLMFSNQWRPLKSYCLRPNKITGPNLEGNCIYFKMSLHNKSHKRLRRATSCRLLLTSYLCAINFR